MKVKELREILNKCDGELEVILSQDQEGNGFYDILEVETDNLHCRGQWEKQLCYVKLTPELEKRGYTKEDIYEDGTPCIVLWSSR